MKRLLNRIKKLFKKKELVDVISRHEGNVTYVGKSTTEGKLIKFKNGNGLNHCYPHLLKVNFKVGDTIRVGDVLGKKDRNGKYSHL